jgi:hypothetical protein
MERVAKNEGLYAEEIVNQCLMDSEYNLREILVAVLTFIQQGILVPQDNKRTLHLFTETSQPRDTTDPDSFEDDQVRIEPFVEDILRVSSEIIEDDQMTDIEWLHTILEKITPSPLADSLKSDILERDLIFESDIRIKMHSTRIETLSKTDLKRWARIMDGKGFVLSEQMTNPLNGIKMVFRSETIKIACSLAELMNGEYLLILAEIL